MIYVALTFHPNQKNPARESGYGVYRVVDSWYDGQALWPEFRQTVRVYQQLLLLHASRLYKRGSRVDPLKIALAARRAA